MSEVTCPEPGVYEDVPFDQYVQWPAVSSSRLGQMAKSPKHYLTPFRESTPSMRLGSLVHCGRLEPLCIAERYAVLKDWHLDPENVTKSGEKSENKGTVYYRQKLAEFNEANSGKELVDRDQYRIMAGICKSIDDDLVARELFNEAGPVEVSFVWDDDETGLRCKGRIDKLGPKSSRMTDLKTCADLAQFQRSIANYGYHRQAAFYRHGWSVLTGELLTPWLCAVESSAPFCVHAAPLSESSVASGEYEFRRQLNRVAECHANGEWPGPDGPDVWEIPEWAMPDLFNLA
ncbi:PD-(D/E)XK nuclease-like domain-containing protein [Botrimarina mediterranea]|uniref:PD-(D/E)XK nuclease-like domain-containing protein n=1 Tax=Botrimarina mediterranea TaxID=2528022 RepID=UPI00118B6C50|nr:Exodeoxyribonuclease 8 [Planctomycetes bacterium K2D]